MEKESLDEILSDVKREGENPFETLDTTPSESAPEKVEEAKAEDKEDEDNLPFHKHPRWIARENELSDLRESNEATARELEELKTIKESKTNNSKSDIPDWFSELYGENETAWQKYSEHEQTRTDEIENRILARQQEKAQQQVAEDTKWNKWVDSEIAQLEADGHQFERNKLIKTMLDYSPTDANNNLDFKKGIRIYEALEGKPDSAKSDARKELADKTTATTKGEPVKKNYMTPAELRNRSWGSL